MPNLDALNTAIAIVIVLLLLSLIVQSVQALIKKLLKIKSRQLEQSLVDLFEHLAGKPPQPAVEGAKVAEPSFRKSPVMQLLTPGLKPPAERAGGDVEKLYDAVVTRFKEIGRVSASGKHMLDSISKEDLLKILESVTPDTLLPSLVGDLKTAIDGIDALKVAINSVKLEALDGEASAKFAAMHEALAPLLNDVKSLLEGNELKPKLVLGDVINLRQIKLDEVLNLLGEVQKKVQQDIDTESAKPNPTKLEGLRATATGLKSIAGAIIAVRQKFDTALAPVRIKLNEVEAWYDTVMKSFEERYTRGMKTWAVVISFVVVILLNANFFNIYQNIASSDVNRNLILAAGPKLLASAEARNKPSGTSSKNEQNETSPPAASPTPAASPAPAASPTPAPAGAPAPVTSPAPLPEEQTPEEIMASLKAIQEQLKGDVDAYSGFGFTPLKLDQVSYRLSTWWPDEKKHPCKNDQTCGEFFLKSRMRDLRTLLGWTITALLLSVGAPFWQDTLESLFGVKSLLRKRSDKQNVETESGARNPKT